MAKPQQYLKRRFLDTAPYFEWPPDTRPHETALAAREQFLRIFNNHKPEFLPRVAQEVLPLYQSILKMGKNHFKGDLAERFRVVTKSWHSLGTSLGQQEPEDEKLQAGYGLIWIRREEFEANGAEELYESLCMLTIKLQYLSNKLWLMEEWWFDHLLQTLNLWHRTRRRKNFDWLYRLEYYRPVPCVLEPFFFAFFPWSTRTESWASYERNMDEAYEEMKLSFKERRLRQHTSDYGGPRRLAREKRELMHFTWLIEYQVNGMRMSEIAEKYSSGKGMSLATISEAVHTLAELLNIILRPQNRARV
jgi:hypothetical protein